MGIDLDELDETGGADSRQRSQSEGKRYVAKAAGGSGDPFYLEQGRVCIGGQTLTEEELSKIKRRNQIAHLYYSDGDISKVHFVIYASRESKTPFMLITGKKSIYYKFSPDNSTDLRQEAIKNRSVPGATIQPIQSILNGFFNIGMGSETILVKELDEIQRTLLEKVIKYEPKKDPKTGLYIREPVIKDGQPVFENGEQKTRDKLFPREQIVRVEVGPYMKPGRDGRNRAVFQLAKPDSDLELIVEETSSSR